MSRTSSRLTRAGNRINQTYAGRHFKSVLEHESYFLNAYKYLHQNPLRAGIVDRVEDYKYSSLYGALGQDRTLIPAKQVDDLFDDTEAHLEWLNCRPNNKKEAGVRIGLRKQVFRPGKENSTGKPTIEKGELI